MTTLPINYADTCEPGSHSPLRRIAYYQFGREDNPDKVICLHGLTRNGLDFEWLALELAKDFHVICPDMAGRGNSDWLADKSAYNYATYIADIGALSAALSLTQVDWIGTSMGGILGMMLAAQQPSFIKSLVLNDIGAVVSAQGLLRIASYIGNGMDFADKADAMAYAKSIFAPFGIRSEEHWQQLFKASFIQLADGRYALAYDPDIGKPFMQSVSDDMADIDLSGFWNRVECPSLVLRGGHSDILSHANAKAMCESKPQAELVEWAGIGHAPSLLEPAQIDLIADWLKQTANRLG
jgi:pimeloyl-ACP methyl ester carboxylesterase